MNTESLMTKVLGAVPPMVTSVTSPLVALVKTTVLPTAVPELKPVVNVPEVLVAALEAPEARLANAAATVAAVAPPAGAV